MEAAAEGPKFGGADGLDGREADGFSGFGFRKGFFGETSRDSKTSDGLSVVFGPSSNSRVLGKNEVGKEQEIGVTDDPDIFASSLSERSD